MQIMLFESVVLKCMHDVQLIPRNDIACFLFVPMQYPLPRFICSKSHDRLMQVEVE